MRQARQMLSSARTGAGRDDYQTPPEWLAMIRKLGTIMFDPATDATNPTAARDFCALRADVPNDDGLEAEWAARALGIGLTFFNNPYSTSARWIEKAAREASHGSPIVGLVAARPDTRWWRRIWETAGVVGFVRGRISFWLEGKPVLDPKTGRPMPATFPSALVGWNVTPQKFASSFGDRIEVVVPMRRMQVAMSATAMLVLETPL